jgi:hypothetical protein
LQHQFLLAFREVHSSLPQACKASDMLCLPPMLALRSRCIYMFALAPALEN